MLSSCNFVTSYHMILFSVVEVVTSFLYITTIMSYIPVSGDNSESKYYIIMMTSSNGNIFRVTGRLCGEFPTQRPMTRSFDVSLICAWKSRWVNNGKAGDLRRYRAHSDVIVMVILLMILPLVVTIDTIHCLKKGNWYGQISRRVVALETIIENSIYCGPTWYGLHKTRQWQL